MATRSTVATDNFNRSTGLGANWTVVFGTVVIAADNDHCEGTSGSGDNTARWNANPFANNQYAVAKFVHALPSGGDEGQVILRSAGTGATRSQYGFTTDGAAYSAIYKIVSGTYTELATGGSLGWALGDTIEGEVEGTTLRFLRNGTQRFAITDSSLTSGPAGINFYLTAAQLDDWEGGDLVAAGTLRLLMLTGMGQ